LDLKSTLKQLNGQLFPPSISKNKSKKMLNTQEEEMIVSMFEKLVVNCKGRPVDFVKSYLDQYHQEKKSSFPYAGAGSQNSGFPFSNSNVSNSSMITPIMSKMQHP
jgi:hypothetical protein